MPKFPYREEEFWNTTSHGLGFVLGLLGAYSLHIQAQDKSILLFWSVWIYSLSILFLFAASAFYHWAAQPSIKRKLRIIDHIGIYYLIAGTYTPVSLIVLSESRGWLLFWLVWGVAIFGTFLKLFFTGRFEIFSLLLYLVMGWLIVLDLNWLVQNLSHQALLFLIAGGAFYTIGILFYAVRRIPFNHLIWHIFVLCGAICHWIMISLIL
jgi:hemolysin III